jgi:hypothetical protein
MENVFTKINYNYTFASDTLKTKMGIRLLNIVSYTFKNKYKDNLTNNIWYIKIKQNKMNI